MEFYKCEHCESELELIVFVAHKVGVRSQLAENGERVDLCVCTNRDCKNRGVILAIPTISKEDE